MIEVQSCPVCKHGSFQSYLECKDYTVSEEIFNLIQCKNCGFVITSPRPPDKELDKYYQSDAYISHSSKAKTFIDYIYLIARQYTLRWKLGIVNKYSNGTSILDFGCGTGEFLKVCSENQWNITGIEPSDNARAVATSVTGTAEIYNSIEQVDNSFDTVSLWHVLEHVPNIHQTLEDLKSRMKQNGTMFIAVPNHQSYDAKKYRAYWAGYDVPRHLWHFTQSAMHKLLDAHNLKLIATLPMKLDAYYISLISEKYKNENAIIKSIVTAIPAAIQSNLKAKKTGEYSSLIYIVKNGS